MGERIPTVRLVKTGFKEFDSVLVGGFPRPGIVYIIGHPGVGKTTFALQYLINRAREGEKGLYITTSEHENSLLYRFTSFAFYTELKKLKDQGFINFHDILPVYGQSPDSVRRLIQMVYSSIPENKIKNIVVDSIAGLSQYLTLEDVRTMLSDLVEKTYQNEVTLILIDELPLFAEVPHIAVGEFLSDVLILMDYVRLRETGRIHTRFLVIKSRISHALREYYAVEVTPEEGFRFVGPLSGSIEKLI